MSTAIQRGKLPIRCAVAVTPGTPFPATAGLFLNCTAAGTVTLTLEGGGDPFPVACGAGPTFLEDFAVTNVVVTSGTFASISALYC